MPTHVADKLMFNIITGTKSINICISDLQLFDVQREMD